LERRSSFPLVVGLVLAILVVFIGFVAWGVREAYYRSREMERVGVVAHASMWADPQIARELGTLTNASGFPDRVDDLKTHRTAHVRYHVTGSKGNGDVDVWLKEAPGASWTMTGAILTTADKRTLRIGSPPAPDAVAEKKD
jgi:hypothetical protein